MVLLVGRERIGAVCRRESRGGNCAAAIARRDLRCAMYAAPVASVARDHFLGQLVQVNLIRVQGFLVVPDEPYLLLEGGGFLELSRRHCKPIPAILLAIIPTIIPIKIL